MESTVWIRLLLVCSTLTLTGSQTTEDDMTSQNAMVTSQRTNAIENEIFTMSNYEDDNDSLPPNQAPVDYVGIIALPVTLLIGIFGNTMTIIIVNMREFRAMTLSMILTVLAISDTILIKMFPFNKTFIIRAIGYDVRALTQVGCDVFFWAFKTAKMTSSWFIVLISLERLIAVWLPLKAKIINSRRNILLGILAVYVGIGGYNAVWEAHVGVINNGICMPNKPKRPSLADAAKGMGIAGTTVYSIIPCLIIFCLNAATVTKVLINRREAKKLLASVGAARGRQEDQTGKITIMLVGVSASFLVLVVPIAVLHILSVWLGFDAFTTTDPTMVVFRQVAQLLEHLNYSINFFMYVLCSAHFRSQFVTLMACGWRSRWQESRGSSHATDSASTSNQTADTKVKEALPSNRDSGVCIDSELSKY